MPRLTATIEAMPAATHQPDLFGQPAKRKFVIGEIERRCRLAGIWPVIGTDEVGRGPLAGPVVAAAVVLKDGARLPGLDDSKLLSEEARVVLVPKIKAQSIGWAIVQGSVALIDDINILQASLWAMREAVEQVWRGIVEVDGLRPQVVLIDGNKTIPKLVMPPQKTIVKGDRRSRAIAAAAVLAKVYRDDLMREMDVAHPGYGMAQHKGYPTPMHLEALKRLGPTLNHRRSFAPVAAALKARS
jgi:ribonuclease HII